MRLFVALAIAAVGIGAYAAAAVVFDRRRQYLRWLARRRHRATDGSVSIGPSVPAGSADIVPPTVSRTMLPLTLAALLLVGTVLLLAACASLILL
jgi:hypothetical protein